MTYGTITDTTTADASRGRNQWAFHVIGVVVCAAAAVAAFVAAVVVSFGTSTCNQDDTSQELMQLRFGYLLIGGLLTLVPTVFAVAAAKLRFVWIPWAALAVIAAFIAFVFVTTAEVSTWCF